MNQMSYIEKHEEAEAIKLVEDQFEQLTGSRDLPRPCGYMIAVKIYVRPEEYKVVKGEDGVERTLWLPQVAQEADKYQQCVGLVVGLGPQAFKGERFGDQPWCKVGDWVVLPRYESQLLSFKGIAVALLVDEKVMMVVDGPQSIQHISQADKI